MALTIKLNGKAETAPDGATILTLTKSLGINLRQVAIERNREIVPKSTYGSVALVEGDEIEVVRFIGGG